MSTMYDSDVPGAIPTSAPAVALYDDGEQGSIASPATWDRWPAAVPKMVIVRNRRTVAPVYPGGAVAFDVETGALDVPDLPGCVADQRDAYPTSLVVAYVALSNWPSALLACRNAGIELPVWWVAAWGEPTWIGGAAAHQYAGTATSGGHFDLSTTIATFPPGPASPGPVPPSIPGQGETVLIIRTATKGPAYFVCGGKAAPIQDGATLTALQAAGVGTAEIASPSDFAALLAAFT